MRVKKNIFCHSKWLCIRFFFLQKTVWMKYSLSFLDDWDIINHPLRPITSFHRWHILHSYYLLFANPNCSKLFVAHCETVIQTFLKDYNIKAWISGKEGRIRAQNIEILSKRIGIVKYSRPEKFMVFIKCFSFMKQNSLFPKKIPLIFAYYWTISYCLSYCWTEVIVFQFYQELNAVWSENSELNRRISCILPIFGEIIVYLGKMFVDLKKINCGKAEKKCLKIITPFGLSFNIFFKWITATI